MFFYLAYLGSDTYNSMLRTSLTYFCDLCGPTFQNKHLYSPFDDATLPKQDHSQKLALHVLKALYYSP
jgi:hypothetical protein